MPPAARLGDKTNHGGAIGPPAGPLAAEVATVLIEKAPAAVVGSVHVCVKYPDTLMGPANLVLPPTGPRTVYVGGVPVAAVRDRTACGATILLGSTTVFIGGPL
ncbi:PAAR domain-containing protein [Actinophytocola oryzae]|uniref:Putative Zn-binding protein involved in type VI secretion n=1 Tax=Actinophytocola oryzae TaxID=502181 RepID=A0A4R7VXC8_9PSEU|nr:PAAR domain-containing protein [Actinophytocola oryzae]TDV54773.1 putative Zn-binding protein involved in type VI secretion [Actinophytocola oryzae]